MVPEPMARRLVRMPVRPRTTSSWARYLPPTAGIARPAARALPATHVAARPDAERRRKSLRSIDDSYARQHTPEQRVCATANACLDAFCFDAYWGVAESVASWRMTKRPLGARSIVGA